jgi:hypothetical protein
VTAGCATGEQFLPGHRERVTKSLGEVQGLVPLDRAM